MSVQTVLLDFTIDSGRITDDQSRLEVKKSIEVGLKDFFPNIQFVYETSTANGYLILFHEHQLVYFHVRLFEHGIITINVEYYKKDSVPQMLTFDVSIFSLQKFISFHSSIPNHRSIGIVQINKIQFNSSWSSKFHVDDLWKSFQMSDKKPNIKFSFVENKKFGEENSNITWSGTVKTFAAD